MGQRMTHWGLTVNGYICNNTDIYVYHRSSLRQVPLPPQRCRPLLAPPSAPPLGKPLCPAYLPAFSPTQPGGRQQPRAAFPPPPPLHHLESLCAQRIDPLLLQPNEAGDNSRERLYPPRLTFLAFLDQTLDPDSSCRSAVDQILSYYQSLPHPPRIDPDTSAYCQARARWTCQELIDIRRALARGPALHGDALLAGSP